MKRCMIAIDVQNYFKPSQGTVHHINQAASQLPTVATLFQHDEAVIPLNKMGHQGPQDDTCLVNTNHVYYKYGYTIPMEAIEWLQEHQPDEVILAGGHTDANVLAAGFCLFDAGLSPAIVPLLCYGNDWYMHTVTTGIWRQELGNVYETMADLKFVDG